MKKLTQILQIVYASNFMTETNNDGKVIDAKSPEYIRVVPAIGLASIINSLGGKVVNDAASIKIFIPFLFENNIINTSTKSYLSDPLLFYIRCLRPEVFRYSGLNIKDQVLVLAPKGNQVTYTYQKRELACKPCGQNNIIGNADLMPRLSIHATLDEIGVLIGAPVGSLTHTLDLKIILDGKVFIIKHDQDLIPFRTMLASKIFSTLPMLVSRNSTSQPLKNFTQLLITPEALPRDTIGIIRIPISALELTESDPTKYIDLNNFSIHFPSIKVNINLTVNTTLFEDGSTLFVDSHTIQNPTITANAQMSGFKKITAVLNQYELYANKSKQVRIQKSPINHILPIDPIQTYDPLTQTSIIQITK